MEREDKVLEKYLKSEKEIVKCQAVIRNHLTHRRIKELKQEIMELEKQEVQILEQEDIEINNDEECSQMEKVGFDIWERVLQFVGINADKIIGFGLLNRTFWKMSKVNHLWYLAYKVTFPLIYIEKKEQEDYEFNALDWKQELKKQYLMQSVYQQVLDQMNSNKESGNREFKDKNYSEAQVFYQLARELGNKKEKDGEIDKYMTKKTKVGFYKIMAILHSNCAIVNLKMLNGPKALLNSRKGKKYLNSIKELIDDDGKYKEQFDQLEKKLKYRSDEAVKQLMYYGPFRLCQYSDIPEQSLQKGSMLVHQGSSYGGIFDNSKVLMHEFIRGDSILGVILNKPLRIDSRLENENVYSNVFMKLGGPCEQNHVTILHNIGQLVGSVRVLDGVWWQKDSVQLLDRYLNDNRYKINHYYGYASWFEGQLDGEIQNGGWVIDNSATIQQVFN